MAQAQEAGLMRLDKALRLPPAIPYWDFDLLLRHMPSEELLEKINQQQKVIDFDKKLAAESGGSPLKFLEEQKEQLIDSVFKERLLALDNHSLFTILKTAEHLEQIIFDKAAYEVLRQRLQSETNQLDYFSRHLGISNPCLDPDEFYNRCMLHRLAQGMIKANYQRLCTHFRLKNLTAIHTPQQASSLLILANYCGNNKPFDIEEKPWLKRFFDQLPEDIRCRIPVVVLPVPQPASLRPAPGPSSAYTILGYIVDAALSFQG